ncbi:MAG: hypothetical protein OXF79_19310 [Chloroflexi bacterium]|nr:hypothetical protein [Chloroflexota bacterium]
MPADRPANAPNLALSTDLGRSLRLLGDEQFDRLEKAVAAELRRRGRDAGQKAPAAGALRAQKPGPTTSAGSKSDAPDCAAAVTLGQERLILAASEAGLGPAASARQVQLPQTTVRRAIASARRSRHRPER